MLVTSTLTGSCDVLRCVRENDQWKLCRGACRGTSPRANAEHIKDTRVSWPEHNLHFPPVLLTILGSLKQANPLQDAQWALQMHSYTGYELNSCEGSKKISSSNGRKGG